MKENFFYIPSKDVVSLIQTFNLFLISSSELRSTSSLLSQHSYSTSDVNSQSQTPNATKDRDLAELQMHVPRQEHL